MTIIGVHKEADIDKKLNIGTFIGELIKEIDSNKNEIICIYDKIEEKMNLLHDYQKDFSSDKEFGNLYNEGKKNINEENIEIYINNKKIKFKYIYESNEIGLINVKFKFNKLLTSIACMFSNCPSLKSIDLSSFNSSNVIDMSGMFSVCSSLKSIDLSSFNTNNVSNMHSIFAQCSSLESLDLSSFNTNNVINMVVMFSNCF